MLDEEIGWDRLVASREEITALGDLATQDPLSLATQRYVQLRRYAPAFLEAFEFDAPASGQGLHSAVTLLKELNRTGKRKLPDIVPMPFPSKHWRAAILHNGTPQRRTYETAVVATLRDRLRAGDVWVEGSRDYRRFDAYLVPMDEAQRVLGDTALETDGPAWLEGRRERLHDRLREVRAKLAAGRLEGVRLENSRLKITPYDPLTPPPGERLDRAIDALMPRIRITDLLWDVNARTGFLDAFTDLRSGRVHSNPTALLAAILAGATNLGLERMAHASNGVSHAQLSWASAWYLRSETYADALARIIDAHHALPFSTVWGSASTTSSDGQFFASGRNAGEINAKYGPDPGLKIYSFLSGRYGSFHSNVIGATAGEAPFVLDGLVGNAAQFDPLVHHVDTGGVSDHVFALFHLLGLSFAPRRRDFPDRRLACFGRPGRWKKLAPLMGKPINEEVVLEHWNDALRLTASIKNRVRKAFGDAAQARRLPPAESPVSGARRDRAHRTHAVHARVDGKLAAAHGVPGGSQQGRGPTCPRPCRVRAFPGPHPRPFSRCPAKTRHGAEPRHRRHRLLEHVIHREGRQPSAPRATAAEPEPASARLAVGMGAHRVDRRLRLELRGCGAHQRPSVEPLSHETPRIALDAESALRVILRTNLAMTPPWRVR